VDLLLVQHRAELLAKHLSHLGSILGAEKPVREAMRLIRQRDLRGAAAALRSGLSAEQKLTAKERVELEKIASSLARLLQGDVSAQERREILALLRDVQKWLAHSLLPNSRRPLSNRVMATTKKPVKKTAARKSVAKKASVKKGAAKKTMRKALTKKRPAKKTVAKKASAKKAVAKKSTRKAPAKKAGAKRVVRKPAARKPPPPPPSAPTPRRTTRAHPAASAPAAWPRKEAPAAAKPAAAAIKRTPHMDIPPKPLQPGAIFVVSVYVDQKAALSGEETIDVVVEAGAQVEV
jgi:Histone H1-like nucleoprotein HC2